jgi:hypothetical protein
MFVHPNLKYVQVFSNILNLFMKRCLFIKKFWPRANVIKLFADVIYKFSKYARVFVPGKFFQPSLMFVGKPGAYPIEEPFRCCTLGKAPSLAHKQQTWLERIARDKHSSLLQKFVTYGRKEFYNISSRGLYHKTYYGRNLQFM